MRNFCFFVFLFSFVIISSINAQTTRVQLLEGEFKIGATCPLEIYHESTRNIGSALGVELRVNVPNSNWDFGCLFDVTTAVHRYTINESTYHMSNRLSDFVVLGDYNFHQGEKVNPYVGFGIGIAGYEPVTDKVYDISGGTCVFTPRVGVELWRHLRCGLTFHLARKGYNNCELSLGVVFGGGSKK